MRRMIWYEWKRIWGSRLTQFAVLGCALFLAFSVWSNIRLISTTDADGQTVTGLEAVQVQKESRKEVNLDQETVDALVDEYLGYTEDPATSSDDRELIYLSEEMYVKWYLPHQPVLHLIDGAYRTYPEQRNDSMRDVLLQSRGNNFYEARKERVWENLEDAVNRGEITVAEADWWNAEDDAVGEASYGFNRAWWEIINSTSLIILVMLVICIGTAPIFAGEYQSKCDSLLLKADELEECVAASPEEARDAAFHAADRIIPLMEEARKLSDGLETVVDKSFWPVPTYSEILFYV